MAYDSRAIKNKRFGLKTSSTALKIGFNALGFQTAWWLTVAGLVMGYPWLGPLMMSLYLIADHVSLSKNRSELQLILSAMLIGTAADTLFNVAGIISYAGGYPMFSFLAPLWITTMWGGFAATLNHSLAWLKDRPVLAFIMGAVFGPLSYMAGEKFEAVTFIHGTLGTSLILGIFWGLAIPGLIRLQNTLARRSP